jgi:hypothetical protein
MRQSGKITVSDVFNRGVLEGEHPLTDAEVTAYCVRCNVSVPLTHCTVSDGPQTVYIHPPCDGTLVVIEAADTGSTSMPARGYRIGGFVVRNAGHLQCRSILTPHYPEC